VSAYDDAIAKLTGLWPMQDSAASTVVVGTVGGNGTLSTSTTAAKRVAGPTAWLPYGLNLNADSYITTTLAAPTGSAVRTFVGWVKSDTTAEDRKFISSGNSASGAGTGFDFTVETGVRFRHGTGNITYGTLNTSWHHVAAVVPTGATTTDDVIVYIDGVAAAGSRTGGANQTLSTTATNWAIGTRASSPGADLFNGAVSQFGVSGVALTPADIAALYAGPTTALRRKAHHHAAARVNA
jgi:hypothetical protein